MSLLASSLAIGVFLSIVFWQAWNLFSALPTENRQFLDRPAKGFRLAWPLIEVLVHHGGHLIDQTRIEMTTARLRQAGVEYSVSAQQFIAAKIVAAFFFFFAVWGVGTLAGHSVLAFALVVGVAGFFYPELWLRETTNTRRSSILRALPFYLDIITLSVEAGSNLTGGLTQAVEKSADSPLRREISRVLRDIRAGRTRQQALRDMVDRTGSTTVRNVVGGLIQAERTGSSLGPLLRAQAEQLRNERFMRAEKQAMEAPVKLLGPLVMFIFPCTFLVLGFLVLSKAIQVGVVSFPLIVWAYHWPAL